MRSFRMSKANARRVPALGTALFLAIGLFAPQSQAAPAPAGTPAAAGAASASAPRSIPFPEPDVQRTHPFKLSADDNDRAQRALGAPTDAPSPAAKGFSAPAAGDGCPTDLSELISATGSALVQKLKALPKVECTYPLFDLTGDNAATAFRESNLVTVANALRDDSPAYPGDNSTDIGQLVLFLRAAYWVQSNYPAVVGAYGSTLTAATKGALDAFFASPHSKDVTEANAALLVETTKVIDQTSTLGRYAGVYKWLLSTYDGVTAPASLKATVVRFDPMIEDGFEDKKDSTGWKAALRADPTILDAWAGFITRNEALLNHDNLISNTGRYLGYALKVDELKPRLRPILKDLINRWPNTGPTAPITMNLGWATRQFDKGHCADYGICDLGARLIPVILPTTYTCNPDLKIRAQDMSLWQLRSTCTNLTDQNPYFHKIIGDPGVIPGDVNTNLEVVVFNDEYHYKLYAWAFYDIDVDNGGMYEEGDPSKPGNQARFIAHEVWWDTETFAIWNLNHEYTHYLDGRYNMGGDYAASELTPTTWWVEGIAENISFGYRNERNDKAIALAAAKTYKLSELFDTTYDPEAGADVNTNRVYRWGWLAVRYMLQNHRADVDTVLTMYRAADWNGARAFLKQTIGTRYDADFNTWLDACAKNDCGPLPEAPTGPVTPSTPLCTIPDTRQFDKNCRRENLTATTGNYSYHFINLPAGVKTLTITSSGGTGNADLYYGGSNWATTGNALAKSTNAGNDETLTITNPPAGWAFFSLAAQQTFSGTTLSVSYQ
ncbi:collagenase [Kitasatospora sp. NPDC004723]|uniref:M9 family metallopeptidase n=1 Tax=Kitasatospora sp. NPDC004723 TaxID=3154288 RepID=UPI00339F7A0B